MRIARPRANPPAVSFRRLARTVPTIWRGSAPEKFRLWDDCFSFPNLMVWLERSQTVRIRFDNDAGEVERLEASGAFAELLQHEMDHLDGVLAIDRALDGNSLATPRSGSEGTARRRQPCNLRPPPRRPLLRRPPPAARVDYSAGTRNVPRKPLRRSGLLQVSPRPSPENEFASA
ncbi:MAG: peptide deformylase [Acidobacteriia bacterium]|nr:peptide deformylase [Terriglobia bacterium]